MDKLIPIFILATITIIYIGFFSKKKALSTIDDRIKFTSDYQKKFAEYIDKILSNRPFDEDLLTELIRDSKEMQNELGEDGILNVMKDPYTQVKHKNYKLIVDFLPMTIEILKDRRYYGECRYYGELISKCEYAFIQHRETLENQKENIKKELFNPFSSLAAGIKVIILSPLILLRWFGFVPIEKIDRAKNNMLVKLLNAILSFLSLAGTIISIVVGWNDFWNMVFKLFK